MAISFVMSTQQKFFLTFTLFFAAFAAIWHFWIAQYFLRLPNDFTYEAQLQSVDNFYDTEKNEYTGQQYSQATFAYTALGSTPKGMEIENSFEVKKESGEVIINLKRIYGIDPLTGAHVKGLGDEEREGYLFAPRDLKPGEGFTYWHVNYDGPAHMSYVDRTNVYDLEVFKYQADYEGVKIEQTKELEYLDNVPEKYGILLEPQLTLWVEPKTGTLINYQDSTTAYYYDLVTGEKVEPWNHFSNTFSEESIKEKVEQAKSSKMRFTLVNDLAPLILLGLAVLSLFLFSLREHKKPENQPHGHWLIHGFSIVFPVALIFICGHLIKSSINRENELEFENRITEIEDVIIRKVDIAATTLKGIQGLFQASGEVTREEWSVYVDQLELETKYPGIKAVGYSPVVWDADKKAHENAIQEEGFPSYAIRPEGTREYYVPIIYVEPADQRNLSLMGSDSATVDIRKDVINTSRDSGGVVLSGKLVFDSTAVSEKTGAAGVFYIPIYKKNMPIGTIEERRIAIDGYAFASFWIEDFIKGLFYQIPLGVNFSIYDGTSISDDSLLYQYIEDSEESDQGLRSTTDTIYVAGHPWTLVFEGLGEFKSSTTQTWLVRLVLWFAFLLSGLHVFIYINLVRSRGAALGKGPSLRKVLNTIKKK